jgi:hypothetical protein
MSEQTWLNIEHGRHAADRKIAGVDNAMRWSAGSAQGVLDGGEPTELPQEQTEADLRAEVAALRERLDRVEAQLASEPPEGGPARADRSA